MPPAAIVVRTRPCSVRPAKQQFSDAALVARLADLPLRLEVDQHQVGGAADADLRRRQVHQRRARRQLLDDERERQDPGLDELGVDGGERRLQPGRAHRRLLEGHLLLLARVRRVVGGDAVDRARSQPVDQRLAVVLGAQRRVHLQPRVELFEQRLVGQRKVVRARLAGDLHAARLGLGDGLDRLARAQVLDVDAAVLVAGDRGVAGDQRRLGDARDAGEPEPRGDLALVHDAAAGQRRVLLVQGDDPARRASGTAAPCAAGRRGGRACRRR